MGEKMVTPDWLKSTGFFLLVMIVWDIIRIFIQAKVNQWILHKDFENVQKDIDDLEADVEEIIEDTNGDNNEEK